MQRVTIVVALLTLGACGRGFNAPGKSELGTRCESGVACASGICADGRCCASTCGEQQRCDAPGSEGSCVDRKLGDPCDAGAQCGAGGHCVEQVCCDSDCGDLCHTCGLPGSVGTCSPAADYTDPHHDCDDPCGVCYAGVCGPAIEGTDPKDRCPTGQTCSASGQCATAARGSCSTDAECAPGRCIVGECMAVTAEDLFDGVSDRADDLYVMDVAATPDGDEAILFYELIVSEDGFQSFSYDEDKIKLLHHRPGQPWLVDDVCNLSVHYDQVAQGTLGDAPDARIAYVGGSLQVALWSAPGSECAFGSTVDGLRVFAVGEHGGLGVPVTMGESGRDTRGVSVQALSTGTLRVAHATPQTESLYATPTDGGPSLQLASFASPPTLISGTLGQLNGGLVFVDVIGQVDRPQTLEVLALDGGVLGPGPYTPCPANDSIDLVTQRGVDPGAALHLAVRCYQPGGNIAIIDGQFEVEFDGSQFQSFPVFDGNLHGTDAEWVAGAESGRMVQVLEGVGVLGMSSSDGSATSLLVDYGTLPYRSSAAAPEFDGLPTVVVSTVRFGIATGSDCDPGEVGCVCNSDPDTGEETCSSLGTESHSGLRIVRSRY